MLFLDAKKFYRQSAKKVCVFSLRVFSVVRVRADEISYSGSYVSLCRTKEARGKEEDGKSRPQLKWCLECQPLAPRHT